MKAGPKQNTNEAKADFRFLQDTIGGAAACLLWVMVLLLVLFYSAVAYLFVALKGLFRILEPVLIPWSFRKAIARLVGNKGRLCKREHKQHHVVQQIELGGGYIHSCRLCKHQWYERH